MRAIRLNSTVGLVVCILLVLPRVDAYELRTHGSITDQGFGASQGALRYLNEVGIDLGDVFDPQAITPLEQLAQFRNDGTARGWLIEGVIREDDYQRLTFLERILGCEPPLNPLSAIDRPKHHFFDVQRGGAGITVVGGLPAPDWALGLQGRGPADNQNQFSLPDARGYQLSSLTASSRVERGRNTALLFRTLGHAMHVLQDMAQPQHTRNDPHLGCANALAQFVAGEKSWYEKYTEARALNEPYRTRRDANPVVLSGYGPVSFQAYRDHWTNASGSGLAEFSSRNFFSAGTNMGPFSPLGGPCGGLREPVCDAQAYRTEDFDFTIPTLTGQALTGRVRFFLRDIADPLTAQVVQNVRVSSRSLWDQHLETNQQPPKFSLNTYNYDSIADVLLPRAVGYSAGLLDYFFRGQLDVDLVSDSTDPSVARITGTNSSPDSLVDGTLTLYADDGTTGTRSPVTALDPTAAAVANVLPGGALTSAPFQTPGGAERFVAVYQGTLGNELKDHNNPGGVIGKVLGGVRVEAVFIDFTDGNKWKLRTPKGVFLLKVETREAALAYPDLEKLRWGDGENQLVGRTALGPGQPNTLVAYTVPRKPGSVDIPTEVTAEGDVVRLDVIAEQALPFGVPLGTQVNISHTMEYQQQLVTYDRTVTLKWTQPPGVPGVYVATEVKFGPTQVTRIAIPPLSFADTFTIALDLAHYRQVTSPTDAASYGWTLTEVGMTTAGHFVGVIRVNLAAPPFFRWPLVSQPVYGLDATGTRFVRQTCGTFFCFDETVGLRRTFPLGVNPLLWAVVDLTTGEVLGKTAEDVLTIASRDAVEAPRWTADAAGPAPLIYHREIEERVGDGGPANGRTERGWFAEPVRGWDQRPFSTQTELTLNVGNKQTLAGGLRAGVSQGLTQLGFLQAAPGRPSPPRLLAFGDPGLDQKVLEVTTPRLGPSSPLATLDEAQRARPGSGAERLVFLAQGDIVGQGAFNGIVVWDPNVQNVLPARGLLRSPVGFEGEGLSLGSATRSLAIIGSFFPNDGGYLVALDGAAPPRFVPDPDELLFYQALDPQYVYNVGTERFHSARVNAQGVTELQPTALPLVLKNGPGGPIGDYHAIRLP